MSKFSDQEVQFKKRARRRLIGAIVLVVLAVAILPFVLDNEPQPVNETISIQIPPKDAEPAKPVVTEPVSPVPPPATTASVTEESAPTDTKAAPTEPPPAEKEPVKTLEPAQKPAEKVEERKPASEKGGGFIVQLGSYSNPKNAKQAQDRLKKAGIKSYTETAQSGDSKITRVRAGPFASREQAEKVRDKVKTLGFDGVVASK
jgi:DedD protein